MEAPMNVAEFVLTMRDAFPNATWDEDENGDIVIHPGLFLMKGWVYSIPE